MNKFTDKAIERIKLRVKADARRFRAFPSLATKLERMKATQLRERKVDGFERGTISR